MIWRLAHPIRAIVTFVVVLVVPLALVSVLFGGFGIGAPEMLTAVLVALVAAFFANRGRSGTNPPTR